MHNNKLKTCLLAGVMGASLLMQPTASYAANDIAGWTGVIAPAVGGIITYLIAGVPNRMMAVNVDPAQLVLEYLVYDAQQEITYVWEPEPEESYEKAAEANENGSQPSTGTVSGSTDAGTMNFEVQVLEATGIEAVGLEGTTAALATSAGRKTAMEGLTSLETNEAGSLSFRKDMDETGESVKLITTQTQNEQWVSTANIARAELGLLAAQQAAADDGSSQTDMKTSSLTEERNEIASATVGRRGKSLANLAGTGTSTGTAMRIQALMNLEFAQRLNLSDTLQGGVLSLQAARVLRTTDPNETSSESNN